MNTLSQVVLNHENRQRDLTLQRLYLSEGILEDFSVQLAQLPLLNAQKSLRINVISDRSTYPALWQEYEITFSQEQAIIGGDQVLPPLTRLRSCTLHQIIIALRSLEAFLQASPRLSKLALVGCFHVVRPGQDTSLYGHDHYVDFVPDSIRLIGTHCPNLKTFHFSASRFRTPELVKRHVLAIVESFPHSVELNLMDGDFAPNLLKELINSSRRSSIGSPP
ncbi:hypothetical protein BGW39_010840 [Mortierella sp. 14UC]|nr:hypothetical protein BGW39_010840 [Mortierella sp. 14UC]